MFYETWTDHNAALLYCGLVDKNSINYLNHYQIWYISIFHYFHFVAVTVYQRLCRGYGNNSFQVSPFKVCLRFSNLKWSWTDYYIIRIKEYLTLTYVSLLTDSSSCPLTTSHFKLPIFLQILHPTRSPEIYIPLDGFYVRHYQIIRADIIPYMV